MWWQVVEPAEPEGDAPEDLMDQLLLGDTDSPAGVANEDDLLDSLLEDPAPVAPTPAVDQTAMEEEGDALLDELLAM